jgi:hypothetical protein
VPLISSAKSLQNRDCCDASANSALERHFSIQEIAEAWGLCENSVRELFKAEPGVIRIERPRSRYKRTYTTLRIPASVVERVHRRMSMVA